MRKTKAYKSLPYNPALKNNAKALRKAGILHEALLWLQLKNKKFNNLDFDRQKIIGNYIVDFYCAEKSVVIEVDGSSHDNKQHQDAERDCYLESLGLCVIRLLVKDVLQNMGGVVVFLKNHPALAGTPPEEGNCFVEAGTPSEEGNCFVEAGTPPEEGNCFVEAGTPPEEGNCFVEAGTPSEEGNCFVEAGTPPEEGNCFVEAGTPPEEGNCFVETATSSDVGNNHLHIKEET